MIEDYTEILTSPTSLDGYSISPDALFKCLSMTFPPSMAQLVQELVNPVPDFDTIAKILSSDPVLAATVLTLVNSPYYALNTKVTELQRAAVVLGTQEILKIALSISYHQNLSKATSAHNFSFYADWRLVVWSSIAAEEIALHLAPDEAHLAYLSSLLKDLSLFLRVCICGLEGMDEATECSFTMLEDDQLEKEMREWGKNHAAITSALLAEWNLPEQLLEGISAHHDLDKVSELSPLAQSVILATRWAEVLHCTNPQAEIIIPFEVLITRHLGINPEELEELRSNCIQKFQSILQLLAIEDAPANLRYYRHSLQEMQGFYFNGIELTNTKGGLDALASAMARQLRWNWGLINAELALLVPNTTQYQLFHLEENATPQVVASPTPRNELRWKLHGEKIVFGDNKQPYCILRYLAVELPSQQIETLPVFSSFITQALNQYYTDRAVMEAKAEALDTLPVGVALIDQQGHILEGNEKLWKFFYMDAPVPDASIVELFTETMDISLDRSLQELLANEDKQTTSQFFCTRLVQTVAQAPCIYVSFYKTERHDQLLVMIEDVTEITETEIQVLRQKDFLERLVSSMRELLITVEPSGRIILTSPSWTHLTGLNLFNITAPGSSFAGVWDTSLLNDAVPGMPVEAQLLIDKEKGKEKEGEKTQLELVFSPLGDTTDSDASVLVVGRDLTVIRRLEGEIRKQAMFDGLTGLLNHAHCKVVLEREVERSKRIGRSVGMLFFDLDRFKSVNDTYGHQAGDKVLKLTAQALTESLRKGMDFPCRYGGDEFAIIATEITQEKLESISHRVRAAIRKHCRDVVDASMGAAILKPDESAEQLLRRADSASYTAKKQGGGKTVWAD